MKNEPLILAVETSLGAGSISLLKDKQLIGFHIGKDGSLRSDNLLIEINNLFKQNNLNLNDLDYICVSNSPGSFTGIRTGIATAKGLEEALGCRVIEVSALQAMAYSIRHKKNIFAAAPAFRNQIFWQNFVYSDDEFMTISEVKCGDFKDFVAHQNSFENKKSGIVFSRELQVLFETKQAVEKIDTIQNASDNVSEYLGLFSASILK